MPDLPASEAVEFNGEVCPAGPDDYENADAGEEFEIKVQGYHWVSPVRKL